MVCGMTDQGYELLGGWRPTHVNGVRDYLVDLTSAEDFEALGRVMNAVADKLVVAHPESEIR